MIDNYNSTAFSNAFLKPSKSSHELLNIISTAQQNMINQMNIKPVGDDDSLHEHLSEFEEEEDLVSPANRSSHINPLPLDFKLNLETPLNQHDRSKISNHTNSSKQKQQVRSIMSSHSTACLIPMQGNPPIQQQNLSSQGQPQQQQSLVQGIEQNSQQVLSANHNNPVSNSKIPGQQHQRNASTFSFENYALQNNNPNNSLDLSNNKNMGGSSMKNINESINIIKNCINNRNYNQSNNNSNNTSFTIPNNNNNLLQSGSQLYYNNLGRTANAGFNQNIMNDITSKIQNIDLNRPDNEEYDEHYNNNASGNKHNNQQLHNTLLTNESDFPLKPEDLLLSQDQLREIQENISMNAIANQQIQLQQQQQQIQQQNIQNLYNENQQLQQNQGQNEYYSNDENNKNLLNKHQVEKKQQKIADYKQRELKNCTFKPKINDYGGRRKLGEFLELQQQFTMYVDDKKKKLKNYYEEQKKNEIASKPNILNKSKKIAERKRDSELPIHDRLYQQQQQKEQNKIQKQAAGQFKHLADEDKENTFTPCIHNKSKSLVRGEKIEDLLYKDAKRRVEQQKENSKKRLSNSQSQSRFTSQKTNKILVQKFIKELEYVLQQIVESQCNLQNQDGNTGNQNGGLNNNNNNNIISNTAVTETSDICISQVYQNQPPQQQQQSCSIQQSQDLKNQQSIQYQSVQQQQIQLQSYLQLQDEYSSLSINNNLNNNEGNNHNVKEQQQQIINVIGGGQFSCQYQQQQITTKQIPQNYDLALLFQILIKLGFLKYNNSSQGRDGPIQESEKKLVFLIWSILGGEQYGKISSQNLITLLLSVVGLNVEGECSNATTNYNSNTTCQQQQQDENLNVATHILKLQIKDQHDNQCENNKKQSKLHRRSFSGFERSKSTGHLRRFSELTKYRGLNSSISNAQLLKDQQCVEQQQPALQNINQNNNNTTATTLTVINETNISPSNNNINKFNSKRIGHFVGNGLESKWQINNEERKLIRQTFELLYRNRLTYEELKNNSSYCSEYTFHPQILQCSEQMANQYRERVLHEAARMLEDNKISMKIPENGQIGHSEFLILQKKTQEQHLLQKKIEKQKNELKNCSFKPVRVNVDATNNIIPTTNNNNNNKKTQQQNTKPLEQQLSNTTNTATLHQTHKKNQSQSNSNNGNGIQGRESIAGGNQPTQTQPLNKNRNEELYQMAQIKPVKRDKSTDELQFEKQQAECTFKPNLNKNKHNITGCGMTKLSIQKKSIKDEEFAKNVNKTIERMRNARKEKQMLEQIKEKGFTRNDIDLQELKKTTNQGGNHNALQHKQPIRSSYQQSTSSTASLTHLQNQMQSNAFHDALEEMYQMKQKQSQQQQQQQQFQQKLEEEINPSNCFDQGFEDYDQQQQNDKLLFQQQLQLQQQQQQYDEQSYPQALASSSHSQESNNPLNSGHSTISQLQIVSPQGLPQSFQSPTATIPFQTPANNIQQRIATSPNHLTALNSTAASQIPLNSPDAYTNNNSRVLDKEAVQLHQQGENNSSIEDKMPLLFVDVNLGGGRTERIVVFEGDRSEDLANKFAQIHGLDEQTKKKFKDLLDSQIASLLSRIDEEVISEEDSMYGASSKKQRFLQQ